MHDTLDQHLAALGHDDAHGGLDSMEARVLDAIGARGERRIAARMTGIAALGALAIGVASAALPPRHAVATPADPLAGQSALAPSALLLE